MAENLKHLVLVRHLEDEGTLRRIARKRGENWAIKPSREEQITARAYRDAIIVGRYIVEEIQKQYGLEAFDNYFTSMAQRSIQSAAAMCLAGADIWQSDDRLDERDRGQIRGLLPSEHERDFPESFTEMNRDPLRWIPPGGQAIIPHLTDAFDSFYDDIRDTSSAIIVGHRDQFWAAMRQLEGLTDTEMQDVDTDVITPGYILHYSSIDPESGEQMPELMWKFTIDPIQPESASGWQLLPNIAQTTRAQG